MFPAGSRRGDTGSPAPVEKGAKSGPCRTRMGTVSSALNRRREPGGFPWNGYGRQESFICFPARWPPLRREVKPPVGGSRPQKEYVWGRFFQKSSCSTDRRRRRFNSSLTRSSTGDGVVWSERI